MGLYIGGNAIGGMSGRLITGVLIDFVSWHTAMLTIGGLALGAAGCSGRCCRSHAISARKR